MSSRQVGRVNGFALPMSRGDIEQAQNDARRSRQPHNKARRTFVRSMLATLRMRYAEHLDYEPDQAELNDVTMQLRMNDEVRRTLNLCWLPMSATWIIDQLLSKPEQLRRYAPWLTEEDVSALVRAKGSALTCSDVPLVDEAMELLGPDPKSMERQSVEDARRVQEEQFAKDALEQVGLASGIVSSRTLLDHINGEDGGETAQRAAADREWTYGHVVVDEAQELTAMQWRMLVRRCPTRSFTIVGDVAQTTALGGTRRWRHTMDTLFGEAHWDLNELTINYRNPQEVSDLASSFARRQGLYISTVHAVRTLPDSVSHVTTDDERSLFDAVGSLACDLAERFIADDGSGRVALIAPDSLVPSLGAHVRRALRQVGASENADAYGDVGRIGNRQLGVWNAQEVKGLEYDAVIVVQPGLIEQEAASRAAGAADLYVAMTRPTCRLLIARTRQDENALTL